MSRKPLLLLANPTSGRGRSGRWLERATVRLRRAGIEFESVVTRNPGDAARAALTKVQGSREAWVFGGDGTINEVIQALPGTGVPLAIFPVGTGNVVAKTLKIPRRFEAAYRIATGSSLKAVDVGSVNDRYFLFMLSAGFDARVVHRVAARRQGSMNVWDYWPAIMSVRKDEEPRFSVFLDGEAAGGASWIAVMNTSRYGPGIRLCDAAMNDGKLTVLMLRDPVAGRLWRILWQALRGRLHKLQDGSLAQAQRVRIEGAPEFQLDGDPVSLGVATVELHPLAASVKVRSSKCSLA